MVYQDPDFTCNIQKMESKLKDLSKSRNVTTIPSQFHKEPNDAMHYDLALANHYVEELIIQS